MARFHFRLFLGSRDLGIVTHNVDSFPQHEGTFNPRKHSKQFVLRLSVKSSYSRRKA